MNRCAVVLLVAVAGCGTLDAFLQGDRPSARITGVSVRGLTLQDATLRFDVEVYNPYDAALPLVDLGYSLASGGAPFLDGKAAAAGTVPAKGTRTIPLDARVNFLRLLGALKGVRPGAIVPYEARINLSVEPAGLAKIELPLKKSGEIPVPTVPRVSLSGIKWDKLSLREARAVLKIEIENTNAFALGLTTFAYELALGGTEVAAARAEPSGRIAGKKSRVIEIPLSLSPVSLGLGMLNVLRGQGSDYSLSGTLAVKTPYAPLNLPYSASGRVPFSR